MNSTHDTAIMPGILTNLSKIGSGTILCKAIGFILIPLYTYAFAPEDFALVELLLNAVLLAAPIVSLEISETIVARVKDARSSAIPSASLILLFSFVIQLPIIYFLVSHWSNHTISALFCLLLFSTIFSKYVRTVFRALNLFGLVAQAEVVGTVTFALSIIVFTALGQLTIELFFLFSSMTTIFATLLAIRKADWRAFWRTSAITFPESISIIRYSIPFIPNVIIWWGIELSDKVLLAHFLDLEATGLYSLAMRLFGVLMTINLLLYTVWQPTAIRKLSEEDRRAFFASSFHYFIVVNFLLLTFGMWGNVLLFSTIVDSQYYSGVAFTPLLLMSATLCGASYFFGIPYFIEKRGSHQVATSTIALIVNVLFNVMLIAHIGIWAAVYSTLISYAVLFAMRYFDNRTLLDFSYSFRSLTIPVLLIVLQLCIMTTEWWYLGLPCTISIVLFFKSEILLFLKSVFPVPRSNSDAK